jgi:hypothetical protein
MCVLQNFKDRPQAQLLSFRAQGNREIGLGPNPIQRRRLSGVFRTLRPAGALDRPEEIEGAALETLLFQEARALNDYFQSGFAIGFWRTHSQLEVDLVLYGKKGLLALEITRSSRIRSEDLRGMRAFLTDYPMATGLFFYGGNQRRHEGAIELIPLEDGLKELPRYFG